MWLSRWHVIGCIMLSAKLHVSISHCSSVEFRITRYYNPGRHRHAGCQDTGHFLLLHCEITIHQRYGQMDRHHAHSISTTCSVACRAKKYCNKYYSTCNTAILKTPSKGNLIQLNEEHILGPVSPTQVNCTVSWLTDFRLLLLADDARELYLIGRRNRLTDG